MVTKVGKKAEIIRKKAKVYGKMCQPREEIQI